MKQDFRAGTSPSEGRAATTCRAPAAARRAGELTTGPGPTCSPLLPFIISGDCVFGFAVICPRMSYSFELFFGHFFCGGLHKYFLICVASPQIKGFM